MKQNKHSTYIQSGVRVSGGEECLGISHCCCLVTAWEREHGNDRWPVICVHPVCNYSEFFSGVQFLVKILRIICKFLQQFSFPDKTVRLLTSV